MLVELKKGVWVSCDKCLVEGFVGCCDIDCYSNTDICCEECILNDCVMLSLEEVSTKEEKKITKIIY